MVNSCNSQEGGKKVVKRTPAKPKAPAKPKTKAPAKKRATKKGGAEQVDDPLTDLTPPVQTPPVQTPPAQPPATPSPQEGGKKKRKPSAYNLFVKKMMGEMKNDKLTAVQKMKKIGAEWRAKNKK